MLFSLAGQCPEFQQWFWLFLCTDLEGKILSNESKGQHPEAAGEVIWFGSILGQCIKGYQCSICKLFGYCTSQLSDSLTCQGIVSKRMNLSVEVRYVQSLLGHYLVVFVPALLSISKTEANLNVCFFVVLVSIAMVTN